jgi:hypothetical protein
MSFILDEAKKFYGRLFRREGTLESFFANDDLTAPDEYVHKFVRMTQGDVSFVEVSENEKGPWTLWRVESVFDEAGVYFTVKSTESEFDNELQSFLANSQ